MADKDEYIGSIIENAKNPTEIPSTTINAGSMAADNFSVAGLDKNLGEVELYFVDDTTE